MLSTSAEREENSMFRPKLLMDDAAVFHQRFGYEPVITDLGTDRGYSSLRGGNQ